MRIAVEALTEAGESFAHTYAPGELDLEDEYVRLQEKTRVRGRASRRDEQVEISGEISGKLEADCDLCVAPVTILVEVEFAVSYLPKALAVEPLEDREIPEVDPDFSVYEGNAIDIDELVREQLLLAQPSRFRCSEECKGLCPHCGADLNRETCACGEELVDPRWAALAALKQDKE